jgi:MoxR-like ATPase
MNLEQLSRLQRAARAVLVSDPLLDYVQAVLGHTRNHPDLTHGLSPRCGVFLLHAARAWAFLNGRGYVVPDDVQEILTSVVGHRLQPTTNSHVGDIDQLVLKILAALPIP